MQIDKNKIVAVFFIVSFVCLRATMVYGQDVLRASGATNISIDHIDQGTYTTISGPTIRETASGQLAQGVENIILTLPEGFEWNTNLTAADILIETAPVGANNTDLKVVFSSVTSREVRFSVEATSDTRGNGWGPGRMTISGLQLRPTHAGLPNTGIITNTGSTGPAHANYGNLSTVAGAVSSISVETRADGEGMAISDQDVIAGNFLEVFAIARDAGGNYIRNIALNQADDWMLINTTGGIQSSAALQPSSDRRSAVFAPERTGTAMIQAFREDMDVIPSGLITVLPNSTREMVIYTQPSSTAIAGEPLDVQPVIHLYDVYGNLATNDNHTVVSAGINANSGNLAGPLQQQAEMGTVAFSGLSVNTAGAHAMVFESPGTSPRLSNVINIEAAAPHTLGYLVQPSNTLASNQVTPALELQVYDIFGNPVPAGGIEVTVEGEEANSLLSGTSTVITNSQGIAVFEDLYISGEAAAGMYHVSATFSGMEEAVVSDPFYVVEEGELAGFAVEAAGGGQISDQVAGEPFLIEIRAIDGSGNTMSDYHGTVILTSNSDFEQGEGGTPAFQEGIISEYEIILTTSGEYRIQVEDTTTNRTGSSNRFFIKPGELNVEESSIEASPPTITADGMSTASITVKTRDGYGNLLELGGETITLVTSGGSFGEYGSTVIAEDHNNGIYTAELTSSVEVKTALVEAFIHENTRIDDIEVSFIAGDLAGFSIELLQNNDGVMLAGETFQVEVTAIDAHQNPIPDFSGNLLFSSEAEILEGESASMNDGVLVHTLRLKKAGSYSKVEVILDGNNGIKGLSSPFVVIANQPSPLKSRVSATPYLLQNDGTSQSIISVELRDEYDNQVWEEYSVSFWAQRKALNGLASSGSPDAIPGAITFKPETGLYQSVLTSTTTIELVNVTAFYEGGSMNLPAAEIVESANIDIVLPNSWRNSGGPEPTRREWLNANNWSLNRTPTEVDYVVIPANVQYYPDLDLNVTVGSLSIHDQASLNLYEGSSISVGAHVVVDGNVDLADNTGLVIGGSLTGNGTLTGGESVTVEINGDLSIQNFLARTSGSVVRLAGDQPRLISTENMLVERLNVRNDIMVSSAMVDVDILDIGAGHSFVLEPGGNTLLDVSTEITGNGNLLLNDNHVIIRGDMSAGSVEASESTITFSGSATQQIASLYHVKHAEIDNPTAVRMYEDFIVDGNLILKDGQLIISSGKSLIAPNQVHEGGVLQFRRSIYNVNGWRMMSSPVGTTYGELFEGLTLQGLEGTAFNERQPNLLFYEESAKGTDNQRWRAPGTIDDAMVPGRGYFFYVFGNPPDEDYNDLLPKTLTAQGLENASGNGVFDFPVTYTADADTGWNLLGNPFGAALDWNSNGWEKEQLDETIYVWDSDANNGDGEYRVFNGITGSHDGIIPPFQAFWVKANMSDPELSFNRSALTTGGVFYKLEGQSRPEITEKKYPLITLRLEKGEMESSTFFMFSDKARKGKDSYDAYRLKSMGNTYLEIYSQLENGSQLVINNLPKRSVHSYEIPIGVGGYYQGKALGGEYTISWPKIKDVPDTWVMELIDHVNQEVIDITAQESYNFTLAGNQPNLKAMKYSEPDMQIMRSSSGTKRFTFRVKPDEPKDSDIPEEFSLQQNYPNPFNPRTSIQFALPEASYVSLVVYDILGRQITTLAARDFEAGYHKVDWDASRAASGIYIYRIQAGKNVKSKKMTVIK